MVGTRRRRAANGGLVPTEEVTVISEPLPPMDVESAREKLRQRWELASVLNFLHVFRPVIGSNLKISAEDVETAVIEQNNTLAQLHITLLKGIISEHKKIMDSDSWMIILTHTLLGWWPWVAEGDFPLSGAKGEEVSTYKDLEPTTRLIILKALCEVRADQYDAVSYINEAMKKGTEISNFRKEELAGNGNGIAFWYDGNETIGYRLYKEIHSVENNRVKNKSALPATNSQWETLATNLDEFNKIVNELSSSKVEWEVALRKSMETDVIPVLEKQKKKKERALLREQKMQRLLSGFRHSRLTRSSRNRKSIDYRYDDYDRAIKDAIQIIKKRKPSASDSERDNHEAIDDADDSIQEEYNNEMEDHANKEFVHRARVFRFSKRLAGIPGHTVPESMDLGWKKRVRQRPSVNTAAKSLVVSDSE